jgi:hypothetical protein
LLNEISLFIARAKVTTGLKNEVQIGPNISINPKRTNPTAIASAKTAIAMFAFKISIKRIIGDTAAITKNIEPINSQILNIGRFLTKFILHISKIF